MTLDPAATSSIRINVLDFYISFNVFVQYLYYTRSLGALRAPTSSWRTFGLLDFVLHALWALREGFKKKT